MSALLLAAWPAVAQRPATAGNQNPYWVLEAVDGSDRAISFWDQGRASATTTAYSWLFDNNAPTWHYASLPNPNPTGNAFGQPLIDDNQGQLYITQRGALFSGSGVWQSRVYVSDVQPAPTNGTARFIADVKGQPEMWLLPTLTSALAGGASNTQFCGAFNLLYYEAESGTSNQGRLRLRRIGNQMGTGAAPTVSAGLQPIFQVTPYCGATGTSSVAALPGSRAAIAITAPHIGNFSIYNSRRKQTVYLAVGQEPHISTGTGKEGIYALQLFDDATIPLETIRDFCQCTPDGRPLTLDESRLIGAGTLASTTCIKREAIPGATTGTFTTHELEISSDRKRLAWGGQDGKVYVAALDEASGSLSPSFSPSVVAVADFSSGPGGLGATNNRINGLEFAPNGSYDLYVTVGTDAGSGSGTVDGFYKLTSTGTAFLISYSLSSRYANPGVGPNTQWVAQSQIEADRNGLLRLLGFPSGSGPSSLIAFDPAAGGGAGAFLATNALGVVPIAAKEARNLQNVASTVRRLPRQVDGWDYTFAGHIYGPRYVQTLPYPSTCGGVPAPVPPPAPNATATYAVDGLAAGWQASYGWTVTPLGGAPALTGFVSSGTPTQTITFPTTGGGSYLVKCDITPGTAGCTSYYSFSAEFTVTTDNGCRTPSQRPAPPAPSSPSTPPVVQAYPVPADERLELTRESTGPATVELLDQQGRIRTVRSWAGPSLTLPIATLPDGLYVVRVWEAGQPATTRRVSIAHR